MADVFANVTTPITYAPMREEVAYYYELQCETDAEDGVQTPVLDNTAVAEIVRDWETMDWFVESSSRFKKEVNRWLVAAGFYRRVSQAEYDSIQTLGRARNKGCLKLDGVFYLPVLR